MLIISHTTAKRMGKAPYRTYRPGDRIIPIRPDRQRRKAPRRPIPGINKPLPDETLTQLNSFRMAYGLPPVTRIG